MHIKGLSTEYTAFDGEVYGPTADSFFGGPLDISRDKEVNGERIFNEADLYVNYHDELNETHNFRFFPDGRPNPNFDDNLPEDQLSIKYNFSGVSFNVGVKYTFKKKVEQTEEF